MWTGVRVSSSLVSGTIKPRVGVPARTTRERESEQQQDGRRDAGGLARRHAARGRRQARPARRADVVDPVGRPRRLRLGHEPVDDRARGAQRRRDRQAARPSCRTRRSGAPSAACWRSPTSVPNTTRPTRPAGHGLGVRDHEEQEDHHLGRGHDDAPVVDAAHGRERPVRGHAVARRGEHARGRSRARPRTSPRGRAACSRRVISRPPPRITA